MPRAINTASTRYWIRYTRSSKLKPSSFGFVLLIEPLLYGHSPRGRLFGEEPVERDKQNDRRHGIAQHLPTDCRAKLAPGRYKGKSLFKHLMQSDKQNCVSGRSNRND